MHEKACLGRKRLTCGYDCGSTDDNCKFARCLKGERRKPYPPDPGGDCAGRALPRAPLALDKEPYAFFLLKCDLAKYDGLAGGPIVQVERFLRRGSLGLRSRSKTRAMPAASAIEMFGRQALILGAKP